MSDSVRPHGLQPARLLCPWGSPDKNPGMGCHVLLQGIFPTRVGSRSPTLQADALPSEPPVGGGGDAPEGAQRRGQDIPPLCLRLNPRSPGSRSGPPRFQPRAGAQGPGLQAPFPPSPSHSPRFLLSLSPGCLPPPGRASQLLHPQNKGSALKPFLVP